MQATRLLLAAGLVLAAACARSPAPVPDAGLRLVYEPRPKAPQKAEELRTTAERSGRRAKVLRDLPAARATADVAGGKIVLELPGVAAGALDGGVRRLLVARHPVELRPVADDRTGFLAELRTQLPPGVRVEGERGGGAPWLLQSERLGALRAGIEAVAATLPAGTELLIGQASARPDGTEPPLRTWLVDREAWVSARDGVEARVQVQADLGEPVVAVTLSAAAAERFAERTGAHVGRRLAIVVDGIVFSAPVIRERIGGGRLIVTLPRGDGSAERRLRDAHALSRLFGQEDLPLDLVLAVEEAFGPP